MDFIRSDNEILISNQFIAISWQSFVNLTTIYNSNKRITIDELTHKLENLKNSNGNNNDNNINNNSNNKNYINNNSNINNISDNNNNINNNNDNNNNINNNNNNKNDIVFLVGRCNKNLKGLLIIIF
jgi:hypothetical protein